MNKKKADLLIDQIKLGIEVRQKAVENCLKIVNYKKTESISNIFSDILCVIDEIDNDMAIKRAVRKCINQEKLTDVSVQTLAKAYDSKIKTVNELFNKLVLNLKQPQVITDKLLLAYLDKVSKEEIKNNLSKLSTTHFVNAFDEQRNKIGLSNLQYKSTFVPFLDNEVDEQVVQDVSSYDLTDYFSNTTTMLSKLFGYKVKYTADPEIQVDKKAMIIPNKFLLENKNVVNNCLQLMSVACEKTFPVSFDKLIANDSTEQRQLLLAKYSLLEVNEQQVVANNFNQLVTLLTVVNLARLCLKPNVYKSAYVVIQHAAAQSLRNIQEHINEPEILYLASKEVRKNSIKIFKNTKLKQKDIVKLFEITGFTTSNDAKKASIEDLLIVEQLQIVNYDIKHLISSSQAKPFDIKLIDKNVFFKKCCEKYANEFNLAEKSRKFVLNQSFDNIAQNEKITVIEKMCKDLNITIEGFKNLTLEQSKVIIDAYAYSTVAQAKLNEIREKYFKIKDDKLGIVATDEQEEVVVPVTINPTAEDEPSETTTPDAPVSIETPVETYTTYTQEPIEVTDTVTEETSPVEVTDTVKEETTKVVETPVKEETPVIKEDHIKVVETPTKVVETPVKEELPVKDVKIENPYDVKFTTSAVINPSYLNINTIEEVKLKVAKVLFDGLIKSVNLLANKDLSQIGSKIKYSNDAEIAQASMLITSLNMLFNMKDADKTVRNMFIAQGKTQTAVNLILLKSVLSKQLIEALADKIAPVAYDIKGFKGTDEQLVIEALIKLNEKHYASVEASRLAEIGVVDLYEVPGTFAYQDEVDKINEKYFGNEEQAGELNIVKKNLITLMFNTIIIDEVRKIHRSTDYKLTDKQLSVILKDAFAPSCEDTHDNIN